MAAAQASLTSAALALAASGLPVFPCNARRKPIVEGGFKSATRDPDVIRAMFAFRRLPRICALSSAIVNFIFSA